MRDLIFLDVETTGIDSRKDKIIEVGCVKWRDGESIATYESFVNPGKAVPREITMLTGIAQADVDGAPTFEEIIPALTEFIGDCPIVGHNIQFDTGFLRHQGLTMSDLEIDTVDLAHILLIKEPSYALEVLMKKYQLTVRASHRALVDTETTVEFFNFLLNKRDELDADTLKKITAFVNKTQWSGKLFFEAPSPRTKHPYTKEKTSNDTTRQTIATSWSEQTLAHLNTHDHTLLETPYSPNFAYFKDKPTIWAYTQYGTRDRILEGAKLASVPIEQYKSPAFYLSPKKLAQLIENFNGETERVSFLTKMLVWQAETKTGDREEIALQRDEYSYFPTVADLEGTDTYYTHAFEKAKKAPWLAVHISCMWSSDTGVAKLRTGRTAVIADGSTLEDSLTNADRVRFTQNDFTSFWSEQGTMLTGLLGIFYEKQKEYASDRTQTSFADPSSVMLDEQATSTREWKYFTEAVANLPEGPHKEKLLQATSIDFVNEIAYVNFFADELSYHKVPLFLGPLFARGIEGTSRVVMYDPGLSADGSFTLIKELFECDSSWSTYIEKSAPIEIEQRSLFITIPEEFPDPNTERYFKECIVLFSKLMEQHKGRCLFVVHSKQAAYALYSSLNDKAQQLGIKLLSFGQSGGVGKIITQFSEDPDNTVLFATSSVLPRIEDILPLTNVIVLSKIPFDPPFDPLIKARSEQFSDGFGDYCSPRALMRFKALLNALGFGHARTDESVPQKHLCILDSRLHKKAYGRPFIKATQQ